MSVEGQILVLVMPGVLLGTKFLHCLHSQVFQTKLVCGHSAVSWAACSERGLFLSN